MALKHFTLDVAFVSTRLPITGMSQIRSTLQKCAQTAQPFPNFFGFPKVTVSCSFLHQHFAAYRENDSIPTSRTVRSKILQ